MTSFQLKPLNTTKCFLENVRHRQESVECPERSDSTLIANTLLIHKREIEFHSRSIIYAKRLMESLWN